MQRFAILLAQGPLSKIVSQSLNGAFIWMIPKGGDISALAINETAVMVDFENIDTLIADLHNHSITDIILVGKIKRPLINPKKCDDTAYKLFFPKGQRPLVDMGDDTIARSVINMFETAGFAVRGVHEIISALTVNKGVIGAHQPTEQNQHDAKRAHKILQALDDQDIGQSCVVWRGLCFGIETIQGTDAMLNFVRETRIHYGHHMHTGGVLFKSPKSNQDLRIDMPVIGANTIRLASQAALTGICITANNVIVLDSDNTIGLANENNIALWAE